MDKHLSQKEDHADAFAGVGLAEHRLDYGRGDFVLKKDMHIDHVQPTTNIVWRIQSIETAMRDDPRFAKEMLEAHPGYFIKEKGTIYATKLLYMRY